MASFSQELKPPQNPVRFNAKRWYPSSQEECECCWGLRSPSRAYPHSLNVHCRTARHVANLFEVDESALKKAAKYLDSDAGQLLMLRQRAGLRQQDLADAAGVSVRTVRRWESGETQAPALVVSWLKRAGPARAFISEPHLDAAPHRHVIITGTPVERAA